MAKTALFVAALFCCANLYSQEQPSLESLAEAQQNAVVAVKGGMQSARAAGASAANSGDSGIVIKVRCVWPGFIPRIQDEAAWRSYESCMNFGREEKPKKAKKPKTKKQPSGN